MQLRDLVLYLPRFVDAELCDQFIAEWHKRRITGQTEHYIEAVTGQPVHDDFKVVSLPTHCEMYAEAVTQQQAALDLWLAHLAERNAFHIPLLASQLRYPHNVRILKYTEGQSISPHSDWSVFTHASVTINLNEGYEGGEFEFFRGQFGYSLSKGDVLVFPADHFWVHAVRTITKGERYSINSFIRSHPPGRTEQVVNFLSNLKDTPTPTFDFSHWGADKYPHNPNKGDHHGN